MAVAPPEDGEDDRKYGGWQGTVFTNEKGGMSMVDKEHVKAVVFEMSKGSPHYANEMRKQARTDKRIAAMLAAAKALTPAALASHQRAMDARLVQLRAAQDLTRTWLCVDMDAFFASCAELEDPSLADKPMAVGGVGMISTANYVARQYGVRSAMPGFIALKLCPQLVFAKSDFGLYKRCSEVCKAVFRQYDPECSGGLDEASLDITAYCQAHGMTGEEVAAELRQRVKEATRKGERCLTCSCGVGPNRTLAKICSDRNKPDGQCVLGATPADVAAFVAELPTRKVPGIGKVNEQVLRALGITVCGQLLEKRALLAALFSDITTDAFLHMGLGLGQTRHSEPLREGEVGRKGKSVERTFQPLREPAAIEDMCLHIATKLAGDLAAEGLRGRTLTLKLKTTQFELSTHAVTVPRGLAALEEIQGEALKLLRPQYPTELRLLGLRMSNFLEAVLPPGQRALTSFLAPRGNPAGAAAAGGPAGGEAGGAAAAAEQEGSEAALELSLRDWQAPQGGEPGGFSFPEPEGPGEGSPEGLPGKATDAPGKGEKRCREEGARRARWACLACTYAENHALLLRCEVCDTVRGSSEPGGDPLGGQQGRGPQQDTQGLVGRAEQGPGLGQAQGPHTKRVKQKGGIAKFFKA